ncbi:MAG TPA: SRPBCC domain-containing protein [Mesorhizobium sp.]|nr:SRPBCC domain-containing protein [Mesorhizobium sp.]
MTDTIELSALLPLPQAIVWTLLTEPKHLQAWFGPYVSLEARAGGKFREEWTDDAGRRVVTTGRVEEFFPPERIAWSWADEGWGATTRVRFELVGQDDETELRLEHSGWSAFPDALGDELKREHEVGWRKHLENLARYAADFADA